MKLSIGRDLALFWGLSRTEKLSEIKLTLVASEHKKPNRRFQPKKGLDKIKIKVV